MTVPVEKPKQSFEWVEMPVGCQPLPSWCTSFADMEKFWFETHGTAAFTGLLIRWEPLS